MTFPKEFDPLEMGHKIRVKFDHTLESVKNDLRLDDPDNIVIELEEQNNKLLKFRKVMDTGSLTKTFKDLDIDCWSTWTIVNKNDEMYKNHFEGLIGEDYCPIRVSVLYKTQSKKIITYANKVLKDFKKELKQWFNIPEVTIFLPREGGMAAISNTQANDEKTLFAVNIVDNVDVLVEDFHLPPETSDNSVKVFEKPKDKLESQSQYENDPNIISILVENSDNPGVERYCINAPLIPHTHLTPA